MEKSCDNCMLRKRGECFGGSAVCEFYKHSPSISASEVNSWPVVMRSNSQSRHLEWKKEQQRLAQKNNLPIRENTVSKKTVNSNGTYVGKGSYLPKSSVETNTSNRAKESHDLKEPKETISSIRNSHDDSVLVWIDVRKTVNDQYLGLYLMEYKGRIHSFRKGPFYKKDVCYYEIVKETIETMKKAGFELVFISSNDFKQDVLGIPERRTELNKALFQKGLTCRFRPYEYLSKTISDYVQKHLNK